METETKKGPWKNADGSISLKKILGTIGAIIFFVSCLYGIYKDYTQIGEILNKLGWFTLVLLGIKTLGGAAQNLGSKITGGQG